MTNNTFIPVPLATAVAPIRGRHRGMIDEAVAWSAGRERRLDPDHVALICAGADHAARFYEVSPTRWTRTGVFHVVRGDIPNWCSLEGTCQPESICEALWDWLDFLHATGRLDPESDPVAELHKPLACYGGLDQNGRPLPKGAARQVECECFLPYRETAELLGRIAQRCDRTGEEPLEVLRRAAEHHPAPRWSPLGGDGADLFDELGPGGEGWAGPLDYVAWPDD